jgi:hypothetical protein
MGVLKDIMAISGQGGLFKFISQGRKGVIVEALDSKKRINVPATTKISALEDIAIYTDEEEVPLEDVFEKIFDKEEGSKCISHKSNDSELKEYFAEVLPNYDQERVYVSDIKKVIKWYNILLEMDLLKFDEKDGQVQGEEVVDEKKPEDKNQVQEKENNKEKPKYEKDSEQK